MAMAPQGQEYEHGQRPMPTAANHTATIATNRWGPYSGAGDFASNMAVILAALLAALALALALNAAVRYLLRRGRRPAAGTTEPAPVPVPDLEKAATPPPPPPPALVYSAAGTKLAGAAAECAICLAEFVDGDAVRVMPACGHGFHARCIERWLACGRRSSCPTCRAPLAAAAGGAGTAAPAAAQPPEAAAGVGTAPAGAAQPAETATDAGAALAGAAQPPEAAAAAASPSSS